MSRVRNGSDTRRQFLRSSTGAVVGAAAVAGLSIERAAHAAGDDTVKVGLIGCGGRGTGAASQALQTKGYVKLVAMGDAFQEPLDSCLYQLDKREKLTEKLDVPQDRRFVGLDAYQRVIESGVDLVILTTPPGFRPMHFAAAVAANKHVFMEKPVAVDAPGVRSVLETNKIAKEKGLKVGVGLQRHHQNIYLEAVKRLHDGAIGDIILSRAYWNGGGVWDPRKTREQVRSEMEYQVENWYYYTWLSGDHIVEQHIHNLDVINWVKNAYPVSCQGQGGRQVRVDKKYGEIYDHHFVEYEYADGSRMLSQCRHIAGCWNSVSETVHGTLGTCSLDEGKIETKDEATSWRYRGPQNNPYQTEHDVLFAAIRDGKDHNEGDNGAYSTLTAIMGRMATYSGKIVRWDEALSSGLRLVPDKVAWDDQPPVLPNDDGVYPVAVPGKTVAL